MESSVDVVKKIAGDLNWKLAQVEDVFEVDEDKQGFFVVTLKPKKFLDPADFKMVCSLTRNLGGDGEYVKSSRSWKVPGALAKKQPQPTEPSAHAPTSVPTKKSGFEVLPLAALVSMPFQSRELKNDPSLDELAESIKQTGVVQPIVVREKGGFYEIVMGERRVEASRRGRRGDIPAIVKVLSDEQAYDLQLIENIQRKDLSDMETARALKWRIDSFGYTQDTLAKKLGKTQGWISQRLAMLQIPETITRVIKDGEFTERQAREILAAPPEKQERIIDEINKTGEVPSARELHEIVHPKQTVLCDECGEPVENPIHVEDKYYHDDCYEKVKAQKEPGLAPETPVYFESPEVEEARAALEKETVQEEPPREESQLRAVQIGEFDCTECHKHFLVEHLPNGKHALRLVGEDQD